MAPSRHPLGPLDFAVTVVGGLLATLLVFMVPLTVFGEGSVGGVSADEVCVTTSTGVLQIASDGRRGDRVLGLSRDAHWYPRQVEVCVEEPPSGITAAGVLGGVSELLFALGVLFFISRLLRHARRSWIFSTGVAARTRRLGWFLGVGSLAVAAIAAVGDVVVLRHAVREVTWGAVPASIDFPWLFLVLAFAVITVGRVLEWAVVMQDEVDATV